MPLKVVTLTATPDQIRYLELLAIDLGFDRRNRQLAIQPIIGRYVPYLDELTIREASQVIADWKERRDRERQRLDQDVKSKKARERDGE